MCGLPVQRSTPGERIGPTLRVQDRYQWIKMGIESVNSDLGFTFEGDDDRD
jgi:hypothetical protein